ncbi:MAG: hypothetical protein ACXADY_19485 [Candidatus Hodarchaeales archaeon]
MEDKTESVYEEESGKSFIPSFGNFIPATYTYSREGIMDSNENLILKLKFKKDSHRSWFGKTTLTYDKGKIQIDHKKSSTLYIIYNQNDDLYAKMQFLTKNKVEIKTLGETYYGKIQSKQLEIIDNDSNVCISIPTTFEGLHSSPISSNGSLNPELVSLIVQGWIHWYTGGHKEVIERFEDPNSFSFKIKRKSRIMPENFEVSNSKDEVVMYTKSVLREQLIILGFVLFPFIIGIFILLFAFSGFWEKKITLKSIDGLDLGQVTRKSGSSSFKITDLATNNELDFYYIISFDGGSGTYISSNTEFYSSMGSIIYDSLDNEIISIYGFNKDFKIYKEENHLPDVFIILISIKLIKAHLIPHG